MQSEESAIATAAAAALVSWTRSIDAPATERAGYRLPLPPKVSTPRQPISNQQAAVLVEASRARSASCTQQGSPKTALRPPGRARAAETDFVRSPDLVQCGSATSSSPVSMRTDSPAPHAAPQSPPPALHPPYTVNNNAQQQPPPPPPPQSAKPTRARAPLAQVETLFDEVPRSPTPPRPPVRPRVLAPSVGTSAQLSSPETDVVDRARKESMSSARHLPPPPVPPPSSRVPPRPAQPPVALQMPELPPPSPPPPPPPSPPPPLPPPRQQKSHASPSLSRAVCPSSSPLVTPRCPDKPSPSTCFDPEESNPQCSSGTIPPAPPLPDWMLTPGPIRPSPAARTPTKASNAAKTKTPNTEAMVADTVGASSSLRPPPPSRAPPRRPTVTEAGSTAGVSQESKTVMVPAVPPRPMHTRRLATHDASPDTSGVTPVVPSLSGSIVSTVRAQPPVPRAGKPALPASGSPACAYALTGKTALVPPKPPTRFNAVVLSRDYDPAQRTSRSPGPACSAENEIVRNCVPVAAPRVFPSCVQ
jgi:hypothetical protein